MTSACIEWPGKRDKDGYGLDRGKLVHRRVYTAAYGPIPRKIEIDHTCFNRPCFNLEHLEAVTREENERRRSARARARNYAARQCSAGHSLSGENVFYRTGGNGGWPRKECRECDKKRKVEYRRRHGIGPRKMRKAPRP